MGINGNGDGDGNANGDLIVRGVCCRLSLVLLPIVVVLVDVDCLLRYC